MNEADLDRLIDLSRRGDLDAFGGIVRELEGEVRRHVAMMAVSRDWVDDIAQEIFIEVHRSLARFDKSGSLRKWVRGITRNVVRRHHHEQSRESKLRRDMVSEVVRRRAADRSPIRNEAAEALHGCLDALPGQLKKLIELRYKQEKSSKDIAAVMRRTVDAVRMLLVRTRRNLYECVKVRLSRP